MNRLKFLKKSLGFGLLGLWGCQVDTANAAATSKDEGESMKVLRKQLIAAWDRSTSSFHSGKAKS